MSKKIDIERYLRPSDVDLKLYSAYGYGTYAGTVCGDCA